MKKIVIPEYAMKKAGGEVVQPYSHLTLSPDGGTFSL
jgi:hypothetical protein